MENVRTMVSLTPLERLSGLPGLAGRELPIVEQLLDLYGRYLERNNLGKATLLDKLRSDEEFQVSVSRDGRQFTKLMFDLVQELGGGRPLHRHMLV